jgi:5-formyltetrahydrofolate cyclo-ligase
MQSATTEETRNDLRRVMLERRRLIPTETCLSRSRVIQSKVLGLPQYAAARVIALYYAVENEVETRDIIEHALAHEKKVFCPKISIEERPAFAQISSVADLRAVPCSVAPEPRRNVALTRADQEGAIVLVPGVAFDCKGNRIGRGGGWYDRALEWFDRQALFIGLAYEFQIVDWFPLQHWDKKVHCVITESRTIDCGISQHGDSTR